MNAPIENDTPWGAEVDAQQDAEADAELRGMNPNLRPCAFCGDATYGLSCMKCLRLALEKYEQ